MHRACTRRFACWSLVRNRGAAAGHLPVVRETEIAERVTFDSTAFARLYDHHHRSVRDFCRRRLSPDLVDDAVAETFLTAWRRLDEVPAGDAALTWLYGVAYRVVGHAWRGGARRRRLEGRLRSLVVRPAAGADELVILRHEHRLVLDAAASLNGTDCEVLRLVAWERLSIADVADVLQIEPNAVKQRLHRAVRNLGREYRRLEASQPQDPDALEGGAR
jgi:RNA polymerase sigma factor (sigma-70 family)